MHNHNVFGAALLDAERCHQMPLRKAMDKAGGVYCLHLIFLFLAFGASWGGGFIVYIEDC